MVDVDSMFRVPLLSQYEVTLRQLLTFNNICWAISCGAKSLRAESRKAENWDFGVNIIVDDNMWRQLTGSCVCSLYCFMFFIVLFCFFIDSLHSPWNLNCLFPFPLQVSFVTATPNYGVILFRHRKSPKPHFYHLNLCSSARSFHMLIIWHNK